MYGSVLVTKSIGSLTKGHAARLTTTGTTIAGTSVRHWRLSRGNRSSGPSTGLSVSVSPMTKPAHHWCPTFPSSSHPRNSTSASSTQPLMLVNTSVLVTLSVQNMASSRAGAATEDTVNLNNRSSRYQAIRMATVLIRMNKYRDGENGRYPNGAISSVPPGGYR